MASVELRNVTVTKGGERILDGVDLAAGNGELVAIIGPSGAGKSTLLRVIAGLDAPDSGAVLIDGAPVETGAAARNVAMVFQDNVLYPSRDVAGNVAFPLEMEHRSRSEIRERVLAEGRALHLTRLLHRNPQELSAGHQQLVQIARALVRAPALFLMDEPLARLDAHLRTEMRSELRMVQRGYGVTTLYVTNDPVEAMAMADRVAVLVAGRIVQVAPPDAIYAAPASQVVAELTGALSELTVTVRLDTTGAWLEHGAFRIRAWSPGLEAYDGLGVVLAVRPEQVHYDESGAIEATIQSVVPHGHFDIVTCRVGDDVLEARVEHAAVRPGDVALLSIGGGHVFDLIDGRTVVSWS